MTSGTFTCWSEQEGRALLPGAVCWTATGEQLQVVLSTIEPGRVFEPHRHPHEQFCVVLDGTIEFDVEGVGTRALGPRGVFYFAPNQAHGARVIGEEPVTILEAFHPVRLDYAPGADAAAHEVPH